MIMVGKPVKGLDSWDCGDRPEPFPRAGIRIMGEIESEKIS